MRKVAVLVLGLWFGFVSSVFAGNLYHKFKDKQEIKICLRDVKNEIKDPHVNTYIFRNVFKEVLPKRVNVKFKQVYNERGADVVISAKLKKYEFVENALPTLVSAWAVVADTTAPKSSAKLSVDYQIIDPSTSKVLLEFKNFTTNTRRPKKEMVGGDRAFWYAAEKNINRLLYRAFCKPKPKGSGLSR